MPVSELLIVRHGQAADFPADYDRLSTRGAEQTRLLGAYWAEKLGKINRIFCGPRCRQIASCEVVGQEMKARGCPWPEPEILPALDEFQAEALYKHCFELACARPELAHKAAAFRSAATTEERTMAMGRVFLAMTRLWAVGELQHAEVESWDEFAARVHRAIAGIRQTAEPESLTIVFTSAGPTACTAQMALDLSPAKTIDLAWAVRNASFSRFRFRDMDRFWLNTFNETPHLQDAAMLTYF